MEESTKTKVLPGDPQLPDRPEVAGPQVQRRTRTRPVPWPVSFYRSAVGKKVVMAVTGIVLMGYVAGHMIGNLKMYLGPAEYDHYAEFLRMLLVPLLPRTVTLWLLRSIIYASFFFHIHSAYGLTRVNWRARGDGYESDRDYVAANFASRTMRWTGIIIGLFVIFHLMDLTWGTINPGFVRGEVYRNVTASLDNWPTAIVYIVANIALGIHLYHGSWSLFQSLGWNNPRWNVARRWFAIGFALVIAIGNISFPVMVLAGVVS